MVDSAVIDLAIRNIVTELREQKLGHDKYEERRRRLGVALHANEVVLVRRDDLKILLDVAQNQIDAEYIDAKCREPLDPIMPLEPAQDWLDWMDRHMPQLA